MAYAFSDANKTTFVAVPELGNSNSFTGVQTFTGTTDSTSTTTGTLVISGGMGVQGNLYASKVWGCVWNDLADCIDVPNATELEYGYCYCFDGTNYYKSTKYLDDGIIGIHSDTAGFCMGKKDSRKQMHVGVAGFILCYVDREYSIGTPLTCGEDGVLTELKIEDRPTNFHKIVGTFWKKETADKWGPEGREVDVNRRMWVKIR